MTQQASGDALCEALPWLPHLAHPSVRQRPRLIDIARVSQDLAVEGESIAQTVSLHS